MRTKFFLVSHFAFAIEASSNFINDLISQIDVKSGVKPVVYQFYHLLRDIASQPRTREGFDESQGCRISNSQVNFWLSNPMASILDQVVNQSKDLNLEAFLTHLVELSRSQPPVFRSLFTISNCLFNFEMTKQYAQGFIDSMGNVEEDKAMSKFKDLLQQRVALIEREPQRISGNGWSLSVNTVAWQCNQAFAQAILDSVGENENNTVLMGFLKNRMPDLN